MTTKTKPARPIPPALPDLPPELASWRWGHHGGTNEVQLCSPGDRWLTKWYKHPEHAVAEALRRVQSTPKAETAKRVEYVKLDQIRTDGGTQARAALDEATVAEYAEAWDQLARQQNGFVQMPPIVVYYDGSDCWLADGFHRVAAYRQFIDGPSASASPRSLRAEVRQGTRRDAVLHACGANATHGLRRTNADKRRAIETLLRDEEWRQWSDSEIARRCQVSHRTVADVRADLESTGQISSSPVRYSADGKARDVSGIARSNEARAQTAPPPPLPTDLQAAGLYLEAQPGDRSFRICGTVGPLASWRGSIVGRDLAAMIREARDHIDQLQSTAARKEQAKQESGPLREAIGYLWDMGWQIKQSPGGEYALRLDGGDTYATAADGVIAAAKILMEQPDLTPDQLMAAVSALDDAPTEVSTIPDDIRAHAAALGLLIQERDGGLLLYWPWENTAGYDTQTPDLARWWLHNEAPARTIEHTERLAWALHERQRAGQTLFFCRRAIDGTETAEYADATLAYGEALRISGAKWHSAPAPTQPAPYPAPPARTCDRCHRPATDKRQIGGLLAWRCDECAALAEQMEAMRGLCEQAEQLGATIDYTSQRADGRMKVMPPAGYQQRWLWCDAAELGTLCGDWGRTTAMPVGAGAVDWDMIARRGSALRATNNEVEAWEHWRSIGATLARGDTRTYAARLLALLAPLMADRQSEDDGGLATAINDLHECKEGSEGLHWARVGWALLDIEPMESEALP